jgi:hypothetical protein
MTVRRAALAAAATMTGQMKDGMVKVSLPSCPDGVVLTVQLRAFCPPWACLGVRNAGQ